MPNYGTLIQGRWNARETFEYRSNKNIDDGLFCCLARFRRGLFVIGFAVADLKTVPFGDTDWISPADPLVLLDSPSFQRRDYK
jgi:hypothetical protein